MMTGALFTQSAYAAPEPVEKLNHLPSKVYVPSGFDDNDTSQIVIEGSYPDTCHKVGPTIVTPNSTENKIVIEDQGYYHPQDMCAMMIVPYTKVVDLNVLAAGEYKIYFKDYLGVDHYSTTIKINQSENAGPDDYLYAPISEIFTESAVPGDTKVLVLRGSFTNTCMSFKETKVLNTSPQVMVVLPLAEYKDNGNCQKEDRPFEEKIILDNHQKGKSLLHVRTMNGGSLNLVVDFGV